MTPYNVTVTAVAIIFLVGFLAAVNELRISKEHNTYLRLTLAAVLSRTVQVYLTDVQIEQIAIIVSERLKEGEKWLN